MGVINVNDNVLTYVTNVDVLSYIRYSNVKVNLKWLARFMEESFGFLCFLLTIVILSDTRHRFWHEKAGFHTVARCTKSESGKNLAGSGSTPPQRALLRNCHRAGVWVFLISCIILFSLNKIPSKTHK